MGRGGGGGGGEGGGYVFFLILSPNFIKTEKQYLDMIHANISNLPLQFLTRNCVTI